MYILHILENIDSLNAWHGRAWKHAKSPSLIFQSIDKEQ